MDRGDILTRFLDAAPFALYPFQEEALLAWFEQQGGVLVSAPTGMGKTLIAEAAVFEALHTRRRLYYTTPLIALTDQKFRELQEKAEGWGFPRSDIGLITGNRRENPDALVRVVVAEILLNHLLSIDESIGDVNQLSGVVMDEFHSFNDPERGIVWELSLVLLPLNVRVMLLSATVGNPYEFADWLRDRHGRRLPVVTSAERRVPLEFKWVPDRLLTELLPDMVTGDDATQRSPALVFCFNRDECWELAEKLKGLALVDNATRQRIEEFLRPREDDLKDGVGPKLRQMLIRGVGVHHAGVLPKHKELVETLFLRKLVPFVICTETLAAGINLPARSVVISTLLKGPRLQKTLIAPATAHQIFGRAGRPQFDAQGYVFSAAHEDDVRIFKWQERFNRIDPNSKDPGVMRMRKELERKRPTRRRTEQYWSEGHFKQLIAAGPSRLASRAMIPYQVLIYLLTRTGALHDVREFLAKRFTTSDRIEKFQQQLDFMIGNLAAFNYLTRAEDGDHITLDPTIYRLASFRSLDPLYGAFLCHQLVRANDTEKLLALESVLELPRAIERRVRVPDLPAGPLQTQVLEPQLIALGLVGAHALGGAEPNTEPDDDSDPNGEDDLPPPTFPEMLKLVFESGLANPEPVFVQPKWVAGAAFRFECEFYHFIRAAELVKQEGLILRHLLRLVILATEFFTFTEDPDYVRIAELATRTCRRVDPSYTDRFLAETAALRNVKG